MTPDGNYPPPAPPPPSGLAIAALVVSCIPCACIWVAGVIMGIVALNRIKARPNEVGGRGLAIAAIIVGCTWGLLGTVGVLAAIAIPNFIKFQARAKQSECKTNLKAALQAEKAYFLEQHAYDTRPEKVGFAPEKGRYLYLLGDGAGASVGADTTRYPEVSNETLSGAVPQELRDELGVQGTCPDCSVTIACAGNVDSDATIDVWSVSTAERPGAAAGTLRHDVDDVTE